MNIIGEYFMGHGHVYYCDSQDDCGFWMTPVIPDTTAPAMMEAKRTNVSDRAINRTFHILYDDNTNKKLYTNNMYWLSEEKTEIVRQHRRGQQLVQLALLLKKDYAESGDDPAANAVQDVIGVLIRLTARLEIPGFDLTRDGKPWLRCKRVTTAGGLTCGIFDVIEGWESGGMYVDSMFSVDAVVTSAIKRYERSLEMDVRFKRKSVWTIAALAGQTY